MLWPLILDGFIVAIFGAGIGATELLSRYKDAPFKALRGVSALIYVGLNLVASIATLWLMRLFGVTFGIDPVVDAERLRWAQVFAAGFSAMVLLRSSIFSLNIGEQNISIGPSSLLDALLNVLDREVDRKRAQERAQSVLRIMEGISFTKAKVQLPVVAFALMQNVSRDEQDRVVNNVFGLERQEGVSDRAKAQALGLELMDIVGEKVLWQAVEMIRDQIKETPLGEALQLDHGFTLDAVVDETGETEGDNSQPD